MDREICYSNASTDDNRSVHCTIFLCYCRGHCLLSRVWKLYGEMQRKIEKKMPSPVPLLSKTPLQQQTKTHLIAFHGSRKPPRRESHQRTPCAARNARAQLDASRLYLRAFASIYDSKKMKGMVARTTTTATKNKPTWEHSHRFRIQRK